MWGRRTKNKGQIRKQKAEYKIQPRERGHVFRQEKAKRDVGWGEERRDVQMVVRILYSLF